MKKKFAISNIILVCLVIFMSCGRDKTTEISDTTEILRNSIIVTPLISDTLSDIFSNSLTRRESLSRPSETDLLPVTTGREITIWEHEIEYRRLNFSRYILGSLPHGANAPLAHYDVDLFFRALASLYAPYIYFGGDEVFLPIRDYIIYTIGQRVYWTPCELEELLYDNLAPVILDSHFRLGNRRFRGDKEIFQFNRRFERSENGFFCLYNELYIHKLRLQCSPESYLNVQDSFHFSMDEYGERFFYVPVIILPALVSEFPIYYIKIIYQDNSYEVVPMEMLASSRSPGNWEPPRNIYPYFYPSFEIMEGIPVIAISLMGNPSAPLDERGSRGARQFLALTEQVRYEPVLVLDLRGNGGGYGLLPGQWFRRLTRKEIPSNSLQFAVRNYDTYMAWRQENHRQNATTNA